MKKRLEKEIIANVKNLSDFDLLKLYRLINSYVGDNEISDDLEDIIRLLYDYGGIEEIARAITYGTLNTSNNFFRINNYGNVDGTNDITDYLSSQWVADCVIEYWEELSEWEKEKICDICNIDLEEVA